MKTLFFALLTLPAHADWKFWLANGAHAGAAVADVEITQHCIANHTCREGNPLMPSSRAGAYGVAMGMVLFEGYMGHSIRKQGGKAWWVCPMMGVSAHGVGIGFTVTKQDVAK
jgi:hypothetical protein